MKDGKVLNNKIYKTASAAKGQATKISKCKSKSSKA